MRDLLNLLENLTESRGIGARRPGEEFISNTNPDDKIYVDEITFYPQGRTSYDDREEMVKSLQSIVTTIPNATVDLIGEFKEKDLAFGIAIFKRADPTKTRLAFVKPFKMVNPDPVLNNWNNQTGIPGYSYNSAAAKKEKSNLNPTDVLTELDNLTSQSIVKQISDKFGRNSPLTLVAKEVAMGKKFPIVIPAQSEISFSAFRDYFCEILHPIALQTGNYTGNAATAAEKFLGGPSFADCTINFGKTKTEGLSDSILISPNGQKIKVSSKGAVGANASVKNLIDAAMELKNNSKLLNKHKDTLEILEVIVKSGQHLSPLVLGVKFGIIDQNDSDSIVKFRKLPKLYSFEESLTLMTPKIAKLARTRTPKNPESVNVYFHALSCVAYAVADHVNKKTNFGQAASEILNNGALIQVYTKAVEGTNQWTLKSFDTIWPSNTVTGVLFKADKSYYSTNVHGNFTFKILHNGAVDVPDETEQVNQMVAKSVTKMKPSTASLSADRIRRPGKPLTSPEPSSTVRRKR